MAWLCAIQIVYLSQRQVLGFLDRFASYYILFDMECYSLKKYDELELVCNK